MQLQNLNDPFQKMPGMKRPIYAYVNCQLMISRNAYFWSDNKVSG